MAEAHEYIELGNNCVGVGDFLRALEYFEKAVELDNKNALAWCNLGVVQFRLGKNEDAQFSLNKAVGANPEYSLAWYNLAQMAQKQDRSEEAIKYYYEAIKWDPVQVGMYNELALSLKSINRLEEVVEVFLKALAIEPSAPILYNNLGNVYRVLGRFSEAREKYHMAIALDPNYANAWGNLGVICKITADLAGAKEALLKAVEIKNDQWDFYHNLGVVGQEEGEIGKAIGYFEKSISLNPDYQGSYPCLYLSKRQICDWSDLEKSENNLDKIDDEDPFTTILRSESLVQNFTVAKYRSEAIERVARRKNFNFENRSHKKIRLGYISTDFREHPIGQMVAPVFALHNRKKFEVYAYSYGMDDGSEWRKEVEKNSDVFVEAREMANPELAERINKDEIDILVDVTGYTMGNRLEVLAARPAPIQVFWLGYPGTSGATWFDYLVADKNLINESEEKWYSEKIVYMESCYQINNPTIVPSNRKWTRKECGLPDSVVVFASFNQVYKVEPKLFDVWMEILKKVPKSVIWFWKQDQEAEDNLAKEAKNRGVDPKRLVWAERVNKFDHLSRFKLADISLDTTIYGGHTTTTDSLIAGVPVITCYGTHFASRVSASILKTVGLDELVVKNMEEYKEKAIYLGTDLNKLQIIKEKITRKKLLENLVNPKKFVKNIEISYEKMYKNYYEGQKTERIIL